MKVCFLGEVAGALNGTTQGGGELQIALLAVTLAKAGNEVVIIDYNTTNDFELGNGIKVISIKGWNSGIRYLRAFTHRYPQLYRTLKNQNADIYYCRIRDFRHVFSYWAARNLKAKFILGLASDLDVMSFKMRAKHYYLPNMGHFWWLFSGILSEIIYPFLLRKSDYIFAQHEGQNKILDEKRINSVIFRNLIDVNKLPIVDNPDRKDFIYVGSLDKRKGLIEFFEIVEKTPTCTYKVVGQPRDKTGHLLFEKLKSFKNVTLLGRLNHLDTLSQIANSKALICTSPVEGFPNTFIEAWSYGIPVLSLYVDPGNVIQKESLGFVAHGIINELIYYILNNDFSKLSTEYVQLNHAIFQNKIDEIDSLFKKLL
jgi:glycosyltransferase involved in cell wall biosynthesis